MPKDERPEINPGMPRETYEVPADGDIGFGHIPDRSRSVAREVVQQTIAKSSATSMIGKPPVEFVELPKEDMDRIRNSAAAELEPDRGQFSH